MNNEDEETVLPDPSQPYTGDDDFSRAVGNMAAKTGDAEWAKAYALMRISEALWHLTEEVLDPYCKAAIRNFPDSVTPFPEKP